MAVWSNCGVFATGEVELSPADSAGGVATGGSGGAPHSESRRLIKSSFDFSLGSLAAGVFASEVKAEDLVVSGVVIICLCAGESRRRLPFHRKESVLCEPRRLRNAV